MPNYTRITFDNPLNSSLQVNDMVHFNLPNSISDGVALAPQPAGKVLSINQVSNTILIEADISSIASPGGAYFLFSKDIRANESSLKGYYADVTFQNSSNKKVELFAVSSEIALSSK